MADAPATEKQLAFLKQLTGKDFSDFGLTTKEVSRKIEEITGKKGDDKPRDTGGQKGRSQDTNESIEAQVAFKGFIELCVADKLKVNDPVMLSTIAWGLTKLGAKNEPHKIPAKETGQPLGEEAGSIDKGGGEPPEWADWLKETIEKLDKPKLYWIDWLNETFTLKLDGRQGLIKAIEQLSEGQRQLFFNEIKGRKQ